MCASLHVCSIGVKQFRHHFLLPKPLQNDFDCHPYDKESAQERSNFHQIRKQTRLCGKLRLTCPTTTIRSYQARQKFQASFFPVGQCYRNSNNSPTERTSQCYKSLKERARISLCSGRIRNRVIKANIFTELLQSTSLCAQVLGKKDSCMREIIKPRRHFHSITFG
jgi:hypothetical protein